MADNLMLNFKKIPAEIADERHALQRITDFAQTYIFLDEQKAKLQASRCIQCGSHPCSRGLSIEVAGCPLENNIKDWLKRVAKGDLRSAFEMSLRTNPLNRVINATLCPVQKLCAGACVSKTTGHEAVSMGYVEQFIAELGWKSGWVEPIKPRNQRDQSVGIIGSGPAGTGAAVTLHRLGYRVTMYERNEVPGGLQTIGIPNFKIEKDKVLPIYDLLAESGIDIRCNANIGVNVPYESLLESHDAILHATGAQVTRNPGLPGGGDSLLVPALDALIMRNRIDLQLLKDEGFQSRFLDGFSFAGDPKGLLDVGGQRVAVLGGGDTSIDLVRTWRRYYPEAVTLLYRGTEKKLRASEKEVKAAKDEDVLFGFESQAHEIYADHMIIERPGSRARFDATSVGSAIGFEAENLNTAFGLEGLPVNGGNSMRAEPLRPEKRKPLNGKGSGLTAVYMGKSHPTIIFSAGDAVRGPSLAVLAERDGIDAAVDIDYALNNLRAVLDEDAPRIRLVSPRL